MPLLRAWPEHHRASHARHATPTRRAQPLTQPTASCGGVSLTPPLSRCHTAYITPLLPPHIVFSLASTTGLPTPPSPPLSPAGAVWRGQLIVEGGGFCGTRSKALDLDLSAYDGITLRVRGDGQIFKMNIKTVSNAGDWQAGRQAAAGGTVL